MKPFILLFAAVLFLWSCTTPVDSGDSEEHNLRQITGFSNSISKPAFSPDGQYVYFLEDKGDNIISLDRINVNGTNPTGLLEDNNISGFLISRQNDMIIFDNTINADSTSRTTIKSCDMTGKNVKEILDLSDFPDIASVYLVDYAPVDSLILLDVVNTSGNDVFVYDIKTGEMNNLSRDGDSFASSFSNDGMKVLYITGNTAGGYSINTVDSYGSGKITLAAFREYVEIAGYSSSGLQIYYGATVEPDSGASTIQIFGISPDGTNKRQITNGVYNNHPADYSDDKRYILYSSQRDENYPDNYDVYLYSTDLQREFRIMSTGGKDTGIAISPTDTKVLIFSDVSGMPNIYIYDFKYMYE